MARPFAERPEAFRELQAQLLRRPGGEREMLDILAFEDGVATKTHVLNVLHRLIDGTSTAAVIDALQVFVLIQEPRADIGRHDALRNRDVRHAS